MLCYVADGQIKYEEIYRFPNGVVEKNGHLCWDIEALKNHVFAGIKRCAEIGKIPASVGIDTWGVDFVLLDAGGDIIGDTISYRDGRTEGMPEDVSCIVSDEELYARTGIPKLVFNTIYQLRAAKKAGLLSHAVKMLMMPDYLHYVLTGVAKTEYTNATTTGLVNATTGNWDFELIKTCGYPTQIFAEIVTPGTVLGEFTKEVQNIVGFNAKVVLPATHDTASAVVAVPAETQDVLYISSGTWSIIGTEQKRPELGYGHLKFSNSGGFDGGIIFLKNIMGLWMIQSVKKELDDKYSFAELCALAEKESIASLVDCNHQRFFAPASMKVELANACEESGQEVPILPGQFARVIYNSLANCYKQAAEELERITGVTYPAINIIGGGSQATYLNELTEKYTGKKIIAGPSEATAIGNAIAQMIADGVFPNLQEARRAVML